ncbi:MAG TPA: ADP-ribosylglycohydrolase family protein, partial [Prolixibacteraceae bacterium]|nr:ADP-ribosylglycohydrolase family protein [Prolixibacteraceae bacterium]
GTKILKDGTMIRMSKKTLQDKIKGGWAGQVIGCTFGGPTEYKFVGTMIQDYQEIPWNPGIIKSCYENDPGLYDDIYMDLTFLDVIDKEGIEAPALSHANAFAHAEYSLWHANQNARYNILRGLVPPASGYWKNNPHADDIDFQIEADFAGLMSPGLPNSASGICDRVGHIITYGDGWYGGVFVANMYALAFVYNDIRTIVKEALKSVPQQSSFYKCVSDAVHWSETNPDWKDTWFALQKKWTSEVGCPDGVFASFNIDAKINAAYIVMGLIYGNGDYSRTMEISTRVGLDSDCNPSNAGGILGTMLGYEAIPDFWKDPVRPVEDMDLKYTTISLNDVYQTGYKHALQMIANNGGLIGDEMIEIPYQQPVAVRYEVSFENEYPQYRRDVKTNIGRDVKEYSFKFDGTGFVVTGRIEKSGGTATDQHVFKLETWIDGKLYEKSDMPVNRKIRKDEIAWAYGIPPGEHAVTIRISNPIEGCIIRIMDYIVYGEKEVTFGWKK